MMIPARRRGSCPAGMLQALSSSSQTSSDADDSDEERLQSWTENVTPSSIKAITRTTDSLSISGHRRSPLDFGLCIGMLIALLSNATISLLSAQNVFNTISKINYCFIIPLVVSSYFAMLTCYLARVQDKQREPSQFYLSSPQCSKSTFQIPGHKKSIYFMLIIFTSESMIETTSFASKASYLFSITCLSSHYIKLFPSTVSNFSFALIISLARILIIANLESMMVFVSDVGDGRHNYQSHIYMLYTAIIIGLLSVPYLESLFFNCSVGESPPIVKNDLMMTTSATLSRKSSLIQFPFKRHTLCNQRRKTRYLQLSNKTRKSSANGGNTSTTIKFLDEVYSPFSVSSSPIGTAISLPEVKTERTLLMKLQRCGTSNVGGDNAVINNCETNTYQPYQVRMACCAVNSQLDQKAPACPLFDDLYTIISSHLTSTRTNPSNKQSPCLDELGLSYNSSNKQDDKFEQCEAEHLLPVKEAATHRRDDVIEKSSMSDSTRSSVAAYEKTSDYETGPENRSISSHNRRAHSTAAIAPKDPSSTSRRSSTETAEIQQFLQKLPTPAIQSWHFDIFEFFKNQISEIPFIAIAYHVFNKVGLMEAFNIPVDRFLNFLHYVYGTYQRNPYHNVIHVTDVLHTCFFLSTSRIRHSNQQRDIQVDSDIELSHFKRDKNCIGAHLSPLEVLALYMAAIVHDMGHPGRTNNFLIQTQHELSILYNDRSVLENHHAASAWRAIITNPECNFLCHLSADEFKRLRFLVVDLILATDLLKHNKIIERFHARCIRYNNLPRVDWNSTDERLLIAKMIIKIADVATPCKPLHMYLKWARRVQDEFYEQGDEERDLLEKVSQFMDRENPDEVSLQQNFITNVTLPSLKRFDEAGLFSIGLISNKCHLLEFLHYNKEFLDALKSDNHRIIPNAASILRNDRLNSVVKGLENDEPSNTYSVIPRAAPLNTANANERSNEHQTDQTEEDDHSVPSTAQTECF